ncbi:MAG: hypothetical protein ACOYM5_05945 [Caulobacter sp.]
MRRHVVSLREANRDQWLRETVISLAITTGPVAAAGIINLLFIEGPGLLADLAEIFRRAAVAIAVGWGFMVAGKLAGTLFHDDFGEGLPRLIRSLVLAELTTVIAPVLAIGASLWMVAAAHPKLVLPETAMQTLVGIAMGAGAVEAAVLVVAWLLGRLLNR